jgi:hypothetical protein
VARRFQPAPDYRQIAARVDSAAIATVDRYDRDALVYVTSTGMGRVHVIVVSDRLHELWGAEKEDRLWSDLEHLLDPEAADLVSSFQVLSVPEALRLRGPLDASRLVEIGQELLAELRHHQDELSNPSREEDGTVHLSRPLAEAIGKTTDWVRACDLLVRTDDVRKLVDEADTREELREISRRLKYNARIWEGGPLLLRRLPEQVEAILASLQRLAPVAA